MRVIGLASMLGWAACSGGSEEAVDPIPTFATAMSSAFEVTMFVIDRDAGPFDSGLAPFPPATPAATRFTIYVDILNHSDRVRSFIVTEEPYQRVRVFDASETRVWRTSEQPIPGARTIELQPGERVRFQRSLPDLTAGDYRATCSFFTPGPHVPPDVELQFSVD